MIEDKQDADMGSNKRCKSLSKGVLKGMEQHSRYCSMSVHDESLSTALALVKSFFGDLTSFRGLSSQVFFLIDLTSRLILSL